MKSSNWSLPVKWLLRISLIYLLLPFCIFCLGFLKLYIGLPIFAIMIWVFKRYWNSQETQDQITASKRSWAIFALIVFLWVTLSGIGGLAFQNSDFHFRNAVFHDLINYSWPVKYNFVDTAIKKPETYSLVYYFGFWLPSALIGKLFGWNTANIFLFFWSIIGVFLSILFIRNYLKKNLIFACLLLIFFSGADAIGVFSRGLIAIPNYPTLWPPIQHLEWWANNYQYSSFTTQLFWVFNQAIPAWLCTGLLINSKNHKSIIFVWSLCCFLAPLPALGLAPYILTGAIKDLIRATKIVSGITHKTRSLIRNLKEVLLDYVSLINIIGGSTIFLISFLFLSSNPTANEISFHSLGSQNIPLLVLFLLLEGLLFLILLYPPKKKDIDWIVAFFLLCLFPLIQVGNSSDFCMRASIPTLFLLMLWVGDFLLNSKTVTKGLLVFLLIIGTLTPIYEIDRSIFRTAYFYSPALQYKFQLISQKMDIHNSTINPNRPEVDHSSTLIADDFYSFSNMFPEINTSFLAKENQTFYQKFLEK